MVGERLRYNDLTLLSTLRKPNYKHQTIWTGAILTYSEGSILIELI